MLITQHCILLLHAINVFTDEHCVRFIKIINFQYNEFMRHDGIKKLTRLLRSKELCYFFSVHIALHTHGHTGKHDKTLNFRSDIFSIDRTTVNCIRGNIAFILDKEKCCYWHFIYFTCKAF